MGFIASAAAPLPQLATIQQGDRPQGRWRGRSDDRVLTIGAAGAVIGRPRIYYFLLIAKKPVEKTLDFPYRPCYNSPAIRSGIEAVITGLTRNQFVVNATRGFESHPLRQNRIAILTVAILLLFCYHFKKRLRSEESAWFMA